MRNFSGIFENSRKEVVSCVWVLVREGDEVRLVAHWVKPESDRDGKTDDESSDEREEVTEHGLGTVCDTAGSCVFARSADWR